VDDDYYIDQLTRPVDVIVDKKNNSLIIFDSENGRVARLSCRNDGNSQIIISNLIVSV
jgi:hypothetical protein